MRSYVYFARFTVEKIGYSIDFPNIEGAFTEGDTIEECLDNAQECLELHLYSMLEDGEEIPQAPQIENIDLENKQQFVMPIKVYPETVKYRLENKSKTKSVTIPMWMDKICQEKKLNFSKLLQDAIIREVGYNKIR